jgi:hypothetical protein
LEKVKLDKSQYWVNRINLQVAGTQDDLARFLSALYGGEYSTLVIEKLSVSQIDSDGLPYSEQSPSATTGTEYNLAPIRLKPT